MQLKFALYNIIKNEYVFVKLENDAQSAIWHMVCPLTSWSILKFCIELIAMEYATGHAEELQSMLNALKQHSGNKTPMQVNLAPLQCTEQIFIHITHQACCFM